ncbi:MAG: hypothetical protein V1644_02310 [Candidatus Micrarchaeota archaeon]
MDVKIVSKKQNALFERTEVVAAISGFEATPSRKDVAPLLCQELKCQQEALVVKEILQPFGSKTVKVHAFVYSTPEVAKKSEHAYFFQRGVAKTAAEVPAK